MQTCTKCGKNNPDTIRFCVQCKADLLEFSHFAVALKNLRSNPRVRAVRISVNEDACPVCQQARGNYPIDQVPVLPIKGCSNPNGCHCSYEPWLSSIYP